jgi:hypothetical protein
MKYREALPGLLVLVLRLALVPPARWALDWISVLALIWIAVTLTPEESRNRRWSLAAGCLWLAVIYAVHQGPWTLAGFR